MHNPDTCLVDFPWQQAVYVRPSPQHPFTFSHVECVTIPKAFPSSLSVPSMAVQRNIQFQNALAFRNEPFLILVTGNWGQQFTLDLFQQLFSEESRPSRRVMQRLNQATPYDHVRRLSTQYQPFEDLTADYRHIQYHSSLASFDRGHNHNWKFMSALPFLSDTVILPRTIHLNANIARDSGLKCIYKAFNRAILKSFRDSLFVADKSRFRECNLEQVRRCATLESQDHSN